MFNYNLKFQKIKFYTKKLINANNAFFHIS